MKNIIIFGGSGQVGSSLVKILSQKYNIISPSSSEVSFKETSQIKNFLLEQSPDAIVNCAAYTDVESAEISSSEAFQVNFYAVKEIVDFCNIYSVPLLHISTDYVFNGRKNKEYIEDDHTSPLNVYGWSKLAGETAIKDVLSKYIIVRTSWVFSSTGSNFVSKIMSLLKEKNEIRVVGDQYGCPTSASSLAITLKHILEIIFEKQKFKWGTYHYCNYPPTTWYDLSKTLKQILINKNKNISCKILKISSEEFGTIAERPKFSVLSNNKILKETKTDLVSWEKEITKILSNF